MNPLNPLHLVGGANDYRFGDGDGACGVYTSFDAGRPWSAGLISRDGYDGAGDPSVVAARLDVVLGARHADLSGSPSCHSHRQTLRAVGRGEPEQETRRYASRFGPTTFGNVRALRSR